MLIMKHLSKSKLEIVKKKNREDKKIYTDMIYGLSMGYCENNKKR